jgi:outer membrane protein assembly factor BamD (BamD/ComL family)
MSKSHTIKQALSKAKKLLKQGELSLAVDLYNNILQVEPNNPIARKSLKSPIGDQ